MHLTVLEAVKPKIGDSVGSTSSQDPRACIPSWWMALWLEYIGENDSGVKLAPLEPLTLSEAN
jgi:hypothetical protein